MNININFGHLGVAEQWLTHIPSLMTCPIRIFDATKMKTIILLQATKDSEVAFGIREDWSGTASDLIEQAQLWSSWGTPCVEIDGVKYDCYKIIHTDFNHLRHIEHKTRRIVAQSTSERKI